MIQTIKNSPNTCRFSLAQNLFKFFLCNLPRLFSGSACVVSIGPATFIVVLRLHLNGFHVLSSLTWYRLMSSKKIGIAMYDATKSAPLKGVSILFQPLKNRKRKQAKAAKAARAHCR